VKQPEHSKPLIYDINLHGHRGRGLKVWSTVFGGDTCHGISSDSVQRLVDWPGPVFMQTADYYRALFSKVALKRSASGKRNTVGTLFRPAHLKRFGPRFAIESAFCLSMRMIPGVTLVSMAPRIRDGLIDEVGSWIYDLEWWDIGIEAPDKASELLPSHASGLTSSPFGRDYILFLGTLSKMKGFEFFVDLSAHSDMRHYSFVAAGSNMDIPLRLIERFKSNGGHLLEGYLAELELFELAKNATYIWCCYQPGYNVSSGIFGRALQLRRWPIVREGSWLQNVAEMLNYGTAVPYGRPDSVCSLLARSSPAARPAISVTEMRTHSITTMASALQISARLSPQDSA